MDWISEGILNVVDSVLPASQSSVEGMSHKSSAPVDILDIQGY